MNFFDSLRAIVFFGALGFLFNWIAWGRGFFLVPKRKTDTVPVTGVSVLVVFAIYLLVVFVAAPLAVHGLKLFYAARQMEISALSLGWLQLLLLLLIGLLLFLFCKTQPSLEMRRMWKNQEGAFPFYKDVSFAMIAWALSFPLIMAVGQFADTLVYLFFEEENFEQVAVRYLKMALSDPDQLILALITILFIAPVIEETLFRGFLQNYFKNKWGAKKAIVLSSLCFGLFHVTQSQGFGNISLVISLFTFALFLGFIYERQGSLYASISLHMLFNAISTIRILLSF